MYDISYMCENYDLKNNLYFPRVVAFPRCGSHYFRYIMEYTLECPSLVSSYFYKNPEKCWGVQIHDRWLNNQTFSSTMNLDKVIYLYRNPIDVIFSQLRYDNVLKNDMQINEKVYVEYEKICFQYKKHLTRWKFNNKDIKNILEVKYENMINNKFFFEEVLNFINLPYKEERLINALKKCTKEEINSYLNDKNAMDYFSAFESKKYIEMKKYFSSIFLERTNEIFNELIN